MTYYQMLAAKIIAAARVPVGSPMFLAFSKPIGKVIAVQVLDFKYPNRRLYVMLNKKSPSINPVLFGDIGNIPGAEPAKRHALPRSKKKALPLFELTVAHSDFTHKTEVPWPCNASQLGPRM